MKNKRHVVLAICIGIFVAGLAGSFWVLRRSHGSTVRISQDEKILYTIDLSNAEDQTFETVYDGRTNIIEISNGQIRVKEAECPDQVCVETGWLKNSAPIICLPNHLVIEFADTKSNMDAVAQ